MDPTSVEGSRDWPIVSSVSKDLVLGSIDVGDHGQKTIGKGLYGEVISAVVGGKIYAVKKSTSEHPTSHLNEINLLCRFKHPNIVKAYEIQFIMLAGASSTSVLSRFLMDLHTPLYGFMEAYPLNVKGDFEKSYPWLARAEILYGLIDALAFLQDNNVIYGDIGARNVLVKKVETEGGFRRQAVLTDFGKYHRIGCGTASEVQSQTDLSGYKAAGYTVYENENSKIPLKEEYNVLADAMWALCILVMDISTGHQHLETRGVSFYHYQVRDPKHFEQSVYQPFRKTLVPLLKKLTRTPVDRPCYFRDLLKYRLFTVDTDIADRLGRAKGTVRNIDDVRPPYRNVGKMARSLFNIAYKSLSIGSIFNDIGPVASLAAEYYFRLVGDFSVLLEDDNYNAKVTSIALCYSAACFIVSASTLGTRHYAISKEDGMRNVYDSIAAINSQLGDEDFDLRPAIGIFVSKIVELTQGYTQWWVPYYDDRFIQAGKSRLYNLNSIINDERENHYQNYFGRMEKSADITRVFNEESTPRSSICLKSQSR